MILRPKPRKSRSPPGLPNQNNKHRTHWRARHSSLAMDHGSNPCRHWRLELPAVARNVLPGRASAIAGTRLREPPRDLDRDQLDLLRVTETVQLHQMAR